MKVVALFAGIGGIERGLHRAGFQTEIFCEKDQWAREVLNRWQPEVPILEDIREVRSLPYADLICAGYPCQDLSQAGRSRGIKGARSGLVTEIFRLVASMRKKPEWILLENVPFMLSLRSGEAMRFVADSVEELGYRWAYRIIDTRAFGIPHRRRRVFFLASRNEDPAAVLFSHDAGESVEPKGLKLPRGFYWTEGNTGLGWAVDAIPTLKGGSAVGIPSPPAIWWPKTGFVGTPDIRDAERFQGFRSGTTQVEIDGKQISRGDRWRLVGNAVSVPVAKWVGGRITHPGTKHDVEKAPINGRWPSAATSNDRPGGRRWEMVISEWPVSPHEVHLDDFLRYEPAPLSRKATLGFARRLKRSALDFEPRFLKALEEHAEDQPELVTARFAKS